MADETTVEAPSAEPKKRKTPAQKVQASPTTKAAEQADATEEAKASPKPPETVMSNKDEMNAWTKYSGFVEDTLGLGRNGKRLAHGAIAAGGTYAAGRYAGIEAINNNMPVALAAAGGTGVALTVAADVMFIDAEQEALLHTRRIKNASPEVRKHLEGQAAAILASMKAS
jgi:hypothetical protein